MNDIQQRITRVSGNRSVVFAVAVLVLTLAAILLYEGVLRRKKPLPPSLPPIVRVVEVAPAAEFETKSFPGIAKESQIAKLSFRVAGKLVDSLMTVGARIEKDGVIARLDPRDYELAVQRLEAELLAARSLLSAMTTGARPEDVASLESQRAAARSAFETAGANLERFTVLLADQVASQAQYDLAKTQCDAAKGRLETLENELAKAKTGARKEDVDAMNAKILGLEAGLRTAKNALDDTRLKAPFDGMIVEKYIEDHEVVAPGMPIISFVSVSRIDVAVSLPEEMIVRLDDIRAYRVEFESYPDRMYPATLKELGRAVQRGRQSYPLQVRIDLSKDERPVFPGMAATVLIDLVRPSAPQTLPPAALHGRDDRTAVWVVETASDGTHRVVGRPVKLLRMAGARAEIESDLQPGDKIVSAGARFLTEGQTVRLERMDH